MADAGHVGAMSNQREPGTASLQTEEDLLAVERQIMVHFGIDAPGTSPCFACDLKHFAYMECPPVLPLGTESESWWLGGPA